MSKKVKIQYSAGGGEGGRATETTGKMKLPREN